MKMNSGKSIHRNPADDLHGEDVEAIKCLLIHSWEPIDYDYVRLTPAEKQLISEESFRRLSRWVRTT